MERRVVSKHIRNGGELVVHQEQSMLSMTARLCW